MSNLSLDEQYQALKPVVEHPEFLGIMTEIFSLPAIERSPAVSTRLTPKALADKGVPIPANFHITTRASKTSGAPNTDITQQDAVEVNICITFGKNQSYVPFLTYVEITIPLM